MEVTELNPYKTVSEILSLRSKVKSMKEKLTDLEEKLYMSFKDYVEGSKEKSFKLILKEFLDQFGLARDERRYVKTRLISAIKGIGQRVKEDIGSLTSSWKPTTEVLKMKGNRLR